MSRAAIPLTLLASALVVLVPCSGAKPDGAKASDVSKSPRVDRYGDPLPEGALARFGTIRFRSGSDLQFAALSPDGRTVVTGGDILCFIDASTGRILRQFLPPSPHAANVAFSPDGTLLATLNSLGSVSLLELPSGRVVRNFEEKDAESFAGGSTPVFSGDGRVLARPTSGTRDQGQVCAWETASGKLLLKTSALHNVNTCLAVSADGKTLASWGARFQQGLMLFGNPINSRDTIQLWDLQTAKELPKIRAKGIGSIIGVAFSPDGKSIVVAGETGVVLLLDAANGKELRRLNDLPGPPTESQATLFGPMAVVKFSPDGKRLAVGLDGVRVWDIESGKCLSIQKGPACQLSALVFVGDHLLASGTTGHAVLVWDAVTGKVRGPADAHTGGVRSIAFSADARTLMSVDSAGVLCAWDVGSRRLRSRTQIPVPDHDRPPAVIANGWIGAKVGLSPQGRFGIVANHSKGRHTIRELSSGRNAGRFTVKTNHGLCAGFSADEKWLVLGGKDAEAFGETELGSVVRYLLSPPEKRFETAEDTQIVELIRVGDHKVMRRFTGIKGIVEGVAISPDGHRVAATTASGPFRDPHIETYVWDAESGKQLTKFSSPRQHSVVPVAAPLAFSADGQLLASVEDSQSVWVREAATGNKVCVMTRNGDAQVSLLAFSPDGRMLAIGWSAASEAMRQLFPGEHGDDRIQLWEVSTVTMRKEFAGPDGPLAALAFSNDGRLLASGSVDTTVVLWDVSGDHP